MLETLIKYFVYTTKGHITKNQLIKFLYLADLYAVKWTNKQLTQLNWRYYNQMNGKTIVQEFVGETIFIRLGAEAGNIDDLELPVGLKLMLENIRKEWAGSGQDKIQKLLKYVYSTAPMIEVKDSHQQDQVVRLNLETERQKLINELG
ncbi:MAG: hypothetical protein EAZ23_14860 [Oscillatoriales cyanobacterium]|nr:MAG: hypothetical protein EAZ23_14860 [Oscillatoriales cyanobacterium]